MTDMGDINRLKLVLVEKKKTGKWLAGQLGKDQAADQGPDHRNRDADQRPQDLPGADARPEGPKARQQAGL